MPRLPGGAHASGNDLRRDRPGGAGPGTHRTSSYLCVAGGSADALYSACHGAGTVVTDFARRGISTRTRGSAPRCGSATTSCSPRVRPISMTRAWTKFSRCWSGAGSSGPWPGCARSRYCTEEDHDRAWTTPGQRWGLLAPGGAVAVDVRPDPGGPAYRRRTACPARRNPGRPAGLPAGRALSGAPDRRDRLNLIDRQYAALPSLRQAIVVADDTRDSLRWACYSLVAPPPGITWAHALLDAAVRLLRRSPRRRIDQRRTARGGEDGMTFRRRPGQPVRPGTAGAAGRPDARTLLNAPGSRTVLLDASATRNSGVTLLVTGPGCAAAAPGGEDRHHRRRRRR